MNPQILVADDDNVTQRVLKTVLQRAGYEVLTASEGVGALTILLQRDAPHIAIVDWLMPNLSGPELCAKLRIVNLRIRPYIIILSGKSDKTDVAAALDAGADDYLSKPFNQIEFLARLRVASRIIQAQIELQKYITQLEERAPLVAGETTAGKIAPSVASIPAAAALPVAAPVPTTFTFASPPAKTAAPAQADPTFPPTAPIEPAEPPPPLDFEALVRQAFSPYEFGTIDIAPPPPLDEPIPVDTFTAWSSLIISSRQLWVDLLLTVNAENAAGWHHFNINRPPINSAETIRFITEKQRNLCQSLITTLIEENCTVLSGLTPYCAHYPEALPTFPLPGRCERLIFILTDLSVRLELHLRPCPEVWQLPAALNSGDILSQVFPPPKVSSIAFLNQGVVLTDRYIEKIVELAETKFRDIRVPVYVPSQLASHCQRLIQLTGSGS